MALRSTARRQCNLTDEEVLYREATNRITGSRGTTRYLATRWCWQILAVIALIGLGPAAECLAFTVNPTTLTFEAVQGENPQRQQLLSHSQVEPHMV
jgi:hypothetical protein